MVLSHPAAAASLQPFATPSVLREGEFLSCASVKDECKRLQTTLQHLREAHSRAGLQQTELQVVELYNNTCLHLDAACDGLMNIMIR
jgi:hypothetical protein